MGQEIAPDKSLCTYLSWAMSHAHTVERVVQRHVIAELPPHCVATVQVQYWDLHTRRFITVGSMLLASSDSSQFASNRCVFPLLVTAPRVSEWRLLAQIRPLVSGAALPADVVVSPQLLFSSLCVDVAAWGGDASLVLSIPNVSVYATHAYERASDHTPEEEEVLLLSVSRLRVAQTTGDGRFSLEAMTSLKCVQFDDLSLVDIVEPFTTTAVRIGSSWDVRATRASINASPLLCRTLAKVLSLTTPHHHHPPSYTRAQ